MNWAKLAAQIPGTIKAPAYKITLMHDEDILINYTIVKRETVVNGVTKVFKKVITPNDVKPFYELFLPEKTVLGITSVLLKLKTN